MFIKNQNLLEQVEIEAKDRNDTLMQIFRIQDYYDQNVAKLKAGRYQSGRRVHDRKKMNELQRDQMCPYGNCGKYYATEGSLNLHIKLKHNGGNKTDREKLAKSLVYCKAKGINIPDQLEVNLPPGIVKKAAQQIALISDIEIKDSDLSQLEEKLTIQNDMNEKMMKKLELERVDQEVERAKQMVEAKQCTPPKMSKQFKHRELTKKAGESTGTSPVEAEFLKPKPPSRKVQKIGSFAEQAPIEAVCVDRTNSHLYNNSGAAIANQNLSLKKEFSFADKVDKIDSKMMQNKRQQKANRKN